MELALLGAVVVAAGKGTRMGADKSKQYLHVADKPILVHTLEAFERMDMVEEIILVVGESDIAMCEAYKAEYGLAKITKIVPGGGERQQSVYEGLLRSSTEWVLVHDGVRPFVTREMVKRCYEAARLNGGAVAAVPVKDTIKIADGGGKVNATLDRDTLWAVQTPQVFRRDQLIAAHEAAFADGFSGTDDASIAERHGIPVQIAEGDYGNIKITTPEDLEWAEFRLSWQSHHDKAVNRE